MPTPCLREVPGALLALRLRARLAPGLLEVSEPSTALDPAARLHLYAA